MRILIAYDVCTTKTGGEGRLRRVARACKDYGQRVQKSLFECTVGEKEWTELRERLIAQIDASLDDLRFYFLDADVRIEHHGVNQLVDLEGTLIV